MLHMHTAGPLALVLALVVVLSSVAVTGVAGDVPEASTESCDLLDPEHQQALREQLLEDSCLREVEAVEPHEIKRAGTRLTSHAHGRRNWSGQSGHGLTSKNGCGREQ